MTNPFNCPEPVYKAMQTATCVTPVLLAVRTIGPSRVQWLGSDFNKLPVPAGQEPTCWSLDGARVTYEHILGAAGITRGRPF